ncbi:MAG: AI-2E family transporter [Patescibacteria group bacterium]
MEQKVRIDIPMWVILKVILALLLIYFLFVIKDILAVFFIVLILVAAFDPIVSKWEKSVGRTASVVLLFSLLLVIFSAVIYIIVPPVIEQMTNLIANVPDYFGRFTWVKSHIPDIEKNLSSVTSDISSLTGGFLSVTAGIFGGIFSFFTIIVISAYSLIDRHGFVQIISAVLPDDERDNFIVILKKISNKLSSWLSGQVILGVIVGVLDLIGLLIIGVPYALVLALISGLLEFVPTIGPIIAGVIATIIALVIDPWKGLLVLILYVAVQQLENNIIVPKLMQKAVGLSPVIIIFAILIGAKLLGVVGAILAVPMAATLSVVLTEWPTIKRTLSR